MDTPLMTLLNFYMLMGVLSTAPPLPLNPVFSGYFSEFQLRCLTRAG